MTPLVAGVASSQNPIWSLLLTVEASYGRRTLMVNKDDVTATGFAGRVRAVGREAIEAARVTARFGVRSGVAFDFSRDGVQTLARQALGGAMGPAALFRYHAAARPGAL